MSKVLYITAAAHALVGLGHTLKGLSTFPTAPFQRLPRVLLGMATTGWYQGSVWFLVAALTNYRWATTGMVAPVDNLVAALTVLVCWGSTVRYMDSGDVPTAGLLAVVGGLQAYSAFL